MDDSFKESWNIEENTENQDGENKLENSGIGCLCQNHLSVFVRRTHCCVSEVSENIKTEENEVGEEPVISNYQGEVDRAAEEDVIDGVEDLGEEADLIVTLLGKRPHPN